MVCEGTKLSPPIVLEQDDTYPSLLIQQSREATVLLAITIRLVDLRSCVHSLLLLSVGYGRYNLLSSSYHPTRPI